MDYPENVLLYPKGVKRVAVCLYGLYRTGDYVLPYLKDHFASESIQVDFFCSSRTFEEYRTTGEKVDLVNQERNTLLNKLSMLNPCAVEILDSDTVKLHSWGGRTEKSMADAIMLKQNHEAQNNFNYDVVVLSRYDVVPNPRSHYRGDNGTWLNRIVDRVNKLTYGQPQDRDPIANSCNNWMVTHTQAWGLTHSPFSDSAHDYMLWGSSIAMDLMAAEYLKMIHSVHPNKNRLDKVLSGGSLRHIHMNLGAVLRRNSTTILSHLKIGSTIVRPYADLTLNALDYNDYLKIQNTFVNEKKIIS